MPRRQEDPEPGPAAGGGHGVTVRPKEKDDKTSVTEYMTYFKRIMKVNKWSDQEAGDIFAALLGPNDRSLTGLVWTSFSNLEEQLKAKDLPMREAHLANLMHIEMQEGETISHLRDRTCHLVEQVYPSMSEVDRGRLARDFFLYALPPDLRKHVLAGRPTSLEDTVSVAASCWDMRDSSQSVSAMLRGPQRQDRRQGPRKDIVCWFCREKGHIERFCREKRAQMSERRSGTQKGNERQLCSFGGAQLPPYDPETTTGMGDSS